MLLDGYDTRANAVIETAMTLARSSGELGPLHLLVALSEDDGPVGRLLRTSADHGLRGAVFGDLGPMGSGAYFDFRARQIMGSAQRWVASEGTTVTPDHLLVALADQTSPDVVAACVAAKVDLAGARAHALTTLGWSNENVHFLEPLDAAGTMDRPPLPLSDLPAAVWVELRDRQERLPISRIRRTWQWYALSHNESRAAWRIVNQHRVNDGERYSLLHYHHESVERLAADAIPELMPQRRGNSGPIFRRIGERRRRHLVPRGWVCWLGNRKAGIRDRWFRLTWRY